MKRVPFILVAALSLVGAAACNSTPKVSPALQVKLFQVVNAQQALQIRYNQIMQSELQPLQTQYNANLQQLNLLGMQAFKEAGISDKDYSLNMDTMTFTKKPAPAPAATQPTPKK